MKHWFLPEVPDLLGLLREQARLTSKGIDQFNLWSHGASAHEREVRDSEHQADEAKRRVRVALRSAFTTPLDAEDIYEPSERMDAFDAMGRGKIVGQPTGGSTGQPLVIRLPGGGSARICSKRDRYPDGTEFIGVGVKPDIEIAPTVADVRSGRDVVLEKALRLLGR